MSEEEAKELVNTISREEFPYAMAIAKVYEKLRKENEILKIKYATEILKQKGITTFINWSGFQLDELDERIQDLINLSEKLERKSE